MASRGAKKPAPPQPAALAANNKRNRIKVLSMGDPGVGKSALIKRYCEGRFVSKYISTIGVDFGVKPIKVQGEDVRVCFWDLAGHPDYLQVRNEFYGDAQGVLLVFDVNSRRTFESCQTWLDEAKQFGSKDPVVVVCGNKSDGAKGKGREVTAAEGEQWAASKGFRYCDCSANSGDNVMGMFDSMFGDVVKKVGLFA